MSEHAAGATMAGDFPIVGVGASAGGLAATTELVRHLGAAPGVAIVLVHHLDPTHESGLVEIVARATSMPVAAVREGERVQVNHVYIIPPDADITIAGGALHVTPRTERGGMHLPIDQFFESLAEDLNGMAVGVVLSGTGFDGTNGVRAINAVGGIAFAQDTTALNLAMPTNAIATGCVGFVLPPEGIARELVRLGTRPPTTLAHSSALQDNRELRLIAALMRDTSGVEFTNYKHATLLRRIERRVFLNRLTDLHGYVELLQGSPDELRALCEDALIHVTGFFRDRQVFAALESQVFPRLLEKRGRDAPIRIWVPGCSTGEEVYSLAMSLMGCLAGAKVEVPITIFGTDVSLAVLETARAARYPESIERDVSPGRLQQFFTRTMGGYQISRAVRDACVFARHDITRDPPFSRIDLISCRNLMIYLGTALQDRVMTIFHYALREPGFLVLGSSETVRGFVGFSPLDARARIYGRTSAAPRAAFEFSDRRPLADAPPPTFGHPTSASSPDLYKEVDRLALARFAPPGVVVTEDLAIVHFRGQTGAFLEPTPGAASLDLMRMARDELRLPLRQAIDAARADGRPARGRTVLASSRRMVDVEVVPFTSAATQQRFFVVFFAEDTASPIVASAAPAAPSPTNAEERMAEELASTQRYLESVIEQLEASNEELRAANEEVVSSNEELQSTNEELQTAKEELQASNEELRTVNDEMKEQSAEKTRLNDDLVNVLNSVEIPIVLLGRDMRIRRFTSAAAHIFHFVAGDVGRPFSDITPLVRTPDLMAMAADVLARVGTATATAIDDGGRWYQITIRPYVTTDNRIDGVSICAVDVDDLKKTSQRLDEARAYAESIVDTVHECLVVLYPDLRVRSANRALFAAFGLSPAEVVGVRLDEVRGGMFDIPDVKQLLGRLDEGTVVPEILLEHDFAVGHRSFMLNARRIERTDLRLLALDDVTARRQAEEALRHSERRFFRDVLTTATQAILMCSLDGEIVFANHRAEEIFGFARGEMIGVGIDTLVPDGSRLGHAHMRADYAESPVPRPMGPGRSLAGRTRSGAEFPIEVSLGAVEDEGRPLMVAFVADMTERRRSEQVIREYQARLQGMAFEAAVVEEAERRRIAVALHDRIAQSLALAQLKLTGTRVDLPAAPRADVDQAIELIDQCTTDARSLMFDLSPPLLYDLGLADALAWLAEDFEKRHGVHVELVSDERDVPLDDTSAALLFRAVRELLVNVVKHARTAAARVSLLRDGDWVSVLVEDEGVGFARSGEGAPVAGFGLFSVHEQLGSLGGTVEEDSAPGAGTRIRIRIPLNKSDRDEGRLS